MAAHKLAFAIFGNGHNLDKILPVIERITAFIQQHHATTIVEPSTLDGIDFVISIGGDGTFLRAANKVGSNQIPILGINMGRLGFLADTLPTDIEQALLSIISNTYQIEEHTAIQLVADTGTKICNPHALNDIAILKRDTAAMISIRTYINGEFLVNYQADGLIIATPTGSTAYNLSNGGPIIVPQSGSLCITPVAPHSLNIRPIVINDTSVIDLEVTSRSHNFLVAIDGRSINVKEGIHLTIRKAAYTVKVVKTKKQGYFSTLNQKLLWGADPRQ